MIECKGDKNRIFLINTNDTFMSLNKFYNILP